MFRASRVRALFHGPLLGNCGYSKDGAEAVINAGALDAVAFGRPFLANPDLVERFRKGYPLADTPPYPLWLVTRVVRRVRGCARPRCAL